MGLLVREAMDTMKVAVTLTFDVANVEDVPGILLAIDPPGLPLFDGNARITPEPYVHELIAWLDES